MAAYYSTTEKQSSTQDKEKRPSKTRAQMIEEHGVTPRFPPVKHAAFLIMCLEQAGKSKPGMGGPEPITPTELKDWAMGTGTELGPYDFQDILDGSRAFCAAVARYDDTRENPPWEIEWSEAEMASFRDHQNAQITKQLEG